MTKTTDKPTRVAPHYKAVYIPSRGISFYAVGEDNQPCLLAGPGSGRSCDLDACHNYAVGAGYTKTNQARDSGTQEFYWFKPNGQGQ